MIITQKQLLILYSISQWFIKFEFNGFFPPYSRETIVDILNEIINQQSNNPMEIK
ncbi:MAG TPA: hypothetical protein VNF93_02450 [Buchnera sp. (in: enterobacteria)]|nr:hypothetical protein [Buchnera sp. (in: enterobacteria)]